MPITSATIPNILGLAKVTGHVVAGLSPHWSRMKQQVSDYRPELKPSWRNVARCTLFFFVLGPQVETLELWARHCWSAGDGEDNPGQLGRSETVIKGTWRYLPTTTEGTHGKWEILSNNSVHSGMDENNAQVS